MYHNADLNWVTTFMHRYKKIKEVRLSEFYPLLLHTWESLWLRYKCQDQLSFKQDPKSYIFALFCTLYLLSFKKYLTILL